MRPYTRSMYAFRCCVFIMVVACLNQAHSSSRIAGTPVLRDMIARAKVILIGRVLGVSDTHIESKFSSHNRLQALFGQKVASVAAVHPLKNMTKGEQLKLLYFVWKSGDLMSGPHLARVKRGDSLYLMFLQDSENPYYERTFRPLTYPDSMWSVIDLSLDAESLHYFMLQAKTAERMLTENAPSTITARLKNEVETYSVLAGILTHEGKISDDGVKRLRTIVRDVESQLAVGAVRKE